jgi:hypothetical protein
MDEDLYRYFIGREDQSVNERVMIQRVDQQLRVTRIMLDCCNPYDVQRAEPKLGKYMLSYLSMMVLISSIFLMLSGTEENLQKKDELWAEIKAKNPKLYYKLHYASLNVFSNPVGKVGRKLSVGGYRVARKIYKFN